MQANGMTVDGNDSSVLKSRAFKECAAIFFAVGLLGLVILALISQPRINSARMTCANNLRAVNLGLKLFTGDGDGRYPMLRSTNNGGSFEWATSKEVYRHFVALSNEIGNPKILLCPADTKRSPATNFTTLLNTNLSYWLELNARTTAPRIMLIGDRHLNTNGALLMNGCNLVPTQQPLGWGPGLHGRAGNVGLNDGSVQQVNASSLHNLQLAQPIATNWLAIP